MNISYPRCPLIYLIESNNSFKIGYSSNLDNRLKSYYTMCPNAKILAVAFFNTKDSRKLEKTIRDLVKYDVNGKTISQEWFEGCTTAAVKKSFNRVADCAEDCDIIINITKHGNLKFVKGHFNLFFEKKLEDLILY